MRPSASQSMSVLRDLRAAFTQPTSAQARVLLKVLSLFAGAFLIFAGVWGSIFTLILGGGFVYFVGSIYAVIFGLIVLTVEIKDKTKSISKFYRWIDTYLKFLTLQRGKGAFYLGVGLLVCFMTPTGTGVGPFGVNNVAAIILAIVGFVHTCVAYHHTNTGASRRAITLLAARIHPCLLSPLADSAQLDRARAIDRASSEKLHRSTQLIARCPRCLHHPTGWTSVNP